MFNYFTFDQIRLPGIKMHIEQFVNWAKFAIIKYKKCMKNYHQHKRVQQSFKGVMKIWHDSCFCESTFWNFDSYNSVSFTNDCLHQKAIDAKNCFL